MLVLWSSLACALCDPDDPRPASIACANKCGRYVCTDHAQPVPLDTESPLVCATCWEQLQAQNRIPIKRAIVTRLIDLSSDGEVAAARMPPASPRDRALMIVVCIAATVLFVAVAGFTVYYLTLVR